MSCVAFCVYVVFGMLSASVSWAEQTKVTSSNVPLLEPFNVPDVQTIPACRYVKSGARIITTDPKPKIFTNVKSIYIASELVGRTSLSADTLPLFEHVSLTQLAACTLQTHLATRKTKKNTISSRPIYIPEQSQISEWPEAQEDGNLIVLVQAVIEESGSLDGQELKTVMINTRYYRHDVNDIETIYHQCSRTFSYTEDKSLLHQKLTLAMKTCLERPYVSVCEPSMSCDISNQNR